jgi:hypothetical protein
MPSNFFKLAIPAKAGIQLFVMESQELDSGFRRNDEQ